MKLSTLKARTAAIEQGVWVRDLTADGLALKVRGANNADWRKIADRLWAEVPRGSATNPEVRETIVNACILGAGLLDWNFTDDDGKPVPFDPVLAENLLSEHFIFRQAAIDATTSVQFQQIETVEAAAKN